MTALRRAPGALLLLVLAFGWATRGFCPMEVEEAVSAPATHACHEAAAADAGLRPAPAGCCHPDLATDVPATLGKGAELVAILAPAAAVLPAPAPSHHVAPPAVARADGSSPPVTVLRI